MKKAFLIGFLVLLGVTSYVTPSYARHVRHHAPHHHHVHHRHHHHRHHR